MKLMDKNGRLFGRVSIIDVLVILVVIVMAAALYTSQARTGTEVNEQTITFQIRVRGVDAYVAGAILAGDSLYDQGYSSGGRGIGKITGIQVERDPGTRLSDRPVNGRLAYLEAEGTVDLLLTVEGTGTRSGRSCTLNRVYALGPNAARTYYTKRAVFSGVVSEIF